MVNKCIGCDVTTCMYHAGTESFCTLESIKVTHHSVSDAVAEANTDCASFKLDGGYCKETT